jgi:hypothetical protein
MERSVAAVASTSPAENAMRNTAVYKMGRRYRRKIMTDWQNSKAAEAQDW